MTKTDDVIMERRDSALLRRFLREHLAQTERLCVIMSDADIGKTALGICKGGGVRAPLTILQRLAMALLVDAEMRAGVND